MFLLGYAIFLLETGSVLAHEMLLNPHFITVEPPQGTRLRLGGFEIEETQTYGVRAGEGVALEVREHVDARAESERSDGTRKLTLGEEGYRFDRARLAGDFNL
jgi:hypothetical protein